MPAIWAYCRVSTNKEEQEESLEGQETWAKGLAREWGVEHRVFREQASAKSTIGRPVFQAMMAELAATPKNRRPSHLVVTALDRLSRSLRDTLNVVEALRECGVALYQRGLGVIGSETFPEKAALAGLSLAGEAENYSRSVRAKASWDRRRAEGKPTSNKHPYGLQLQGERDIPIPDSAAWVRRAFEWYDKGEGMYTIARRFAAGAPPHSWLTSKVGADGERIRKTRGPTRWESNRIGKLLRQQRYRGTIVDADLYDRVQQRLTNTPKPGSRRLREYPLSGAIRCGQCGRRLHGHASGGSTKLLQTGEVRKYQRKTRYYGCYVCNYRLRAEVIEGQFFEQVRVLKADSRLLERWIAQPREPAFNAKTLEEIKRLERETSPQQMQNLIDRVMDLALAARLRESELRRQVERIRGEVNAKRQRLEELIVARDLGDARQRSLRKAKALLRDFRKLYDSARYELKRELVATLCEALGGVTSSRAGIIWGAAAPPLARLKRR